MWKMEPNEILLNKGGGGGGNNGKSGEGFIDRSKVRILLCDNDTKSSEEVFDLLCKCSYQVMLVRSPRQVIDALNAEGPDIDIILSEVDLPMAKGFKMLKYIMRDKGLRRIPVIMMSAQDEVSLVVKCLRLGAADYLVKPLRTNELLNLWTHMWRRRRMLGLAEKNIMNCEFDLVPSDPSDANTNSTTLFSDDTDEKSWRSSNPEISLSIHREDESKMITAPGPIDTQLIDLTDDRPNVPEINEQQRGKTMSGPKKSELKIGQSSAFFTYVKSNTFRTISIDETTHPRDHEVDSLTINLAPKNNNKDAPQYVRVEEEASPLCEHGASDNIQGLDYTRAWESELPEGQMRQSEDIGGYNAYSAYPYYLSGAMNHVMMHNQYNNVAHFGHHVPGMPPFPYYPVGSPGVCLPGQVPPWPAYGGGGSSSGHVTVHKLDRREAALIKFRQKRKERCFDKKIRYVNRKKLAERRPRVRGQFVRKINGINVDLNGQPSSNDFDDEDDDDDDEEDEDMENDYARFHG